MRPKRHLLSNADLKIVKYFFLYLFVMYFLYILNFSPSYFLISSGILACFLFGWIIVREYKDNPIKITPVLVLCIFPLLMLGISSVYHGFIYSDRNFETLGPRYLSTKSIIVAYLMVATGLFFQLLGIQLFRPKLNPHIDTNLKYKDVNIFRYFIFFFLISKLIEQYIQLGIIQNILNTIPVAILIFVAVKDRNNTLTSYKYKRNFIFLGAIILFISNIVLLSKASLMLTLIPIFLFYLIQTRKLQKYKAVITMVITAFFYFIFIQPLVTNARLLISKDRVEPTSSFLSHYIISGDYKIPVYKTIKEESSVEVFLNRVFELNAPAYIYEITDRYGFREGETFNNIAIGLIPRIFWPNKPSIPQGQKFSSEILGFENVSIGMLISGELYWNFGFAGIIIGSFLIGIALGYVWKLTNLLALQNFLYFTIYFYLLQSCFGGSEFSAVFLGAIQLIIFFFIVRNIIIVIRKKR